MPTIVCPRCQISLEMAHTHAATFGIVDWQQRCETSSRGSPLVCQHMAPAIAAHERELGEKRHRSHRHTNKPPNQ